MRSTYADLVAEVRQQVDVPDPQAFGWLIDRARVLNAEAAWNLKAIEVDATGDGEYPLPDDLVRTEAVIVNGSPYRRATMTELDNAIAGGSSTPIYAYATDATGKGYLALSPPPSAGAQIVVRYVADVPTDQTASPIFPVDFDEALVDGALALGLARLDERMDSASYFDGRFQEAIVRLRRRRNAHIGRGPVLIRMVT